MKKQLKMFVVLLTLVLNIFSYTNRITIQTVRATYVEGPIVQDTTWTLVDSPFVVSQNVIVYANATLTIEPDVEVRFGENFSLIVNGGIVADGTEDKMIRFTSNKIEPKRGDWGTITLNGTLSSFIHCTIEYGETGITLENGSLRIQNSFVKLNSVGGIAINNGNITVRNSEITNNTMSGIYISGGTQITIQNNVIRSNGDGIYLTGNLTGNIDIEQNNISFNERIGVALEADIYGNIIAIDNNISKNLDGFHVSSNTSTYITHNHFSENSVGIHYQNGNNHEAIRNYILNNTIGIYYENTNNNEAHFNDIYSANPDDFGMDISTTATVNATYNYWGHRSGPKHESLNPYGMGNRIGGDGVDLDFIYFLSAPIDYPNVPPTAVVWADKTLVRPNQPVTFIGSDSHDDGRVDQYFFDFNDTANSGWTRLSLFNHSYSSAGIYNASLRVIDDFGSMSTTAFVVPPINVTNLPSLGVSITLSRDTVNFNEEVLVTVYVSNDIGAVENANVTLFSVKGGSFNPISGLTNSSGYFTTIFKVPNVTEITDVRIIARASMLGYADGSDHEYVKVLPPLIVEITAEDSIIRSEETTTITTKVSLGFRQPIENALVILSSNYGSLSPNSSVTDVNGSATFIFTAPQTLNEMNVTIMAIAVKMEYAQGQVQTTIRVEPKALVVAVNADPTIILSEEASTITVYVTSVEGTIPNATVTTLSDIGGISPTIAETDANGKATLVFTAPQATTREGMIANITITATKIGYVNGEGKTTVAITAKTFIVDVDATPSATISEGRVNMTVHVTSEHELSPVQGANVTVTSNDGGDFFLTSRITDADGNATFVFTAPQVNELTIINITTQVSKIGYIEENRLFSIATSPGILSLEAKPSSPTVSSNDTVIINVLATCNGSSVANVSIAMSSNYGNFSIATGITDSSGQCTFFFKAPMTPMQVTAQIIANATKNGYISAENRTTITVTPQVSAEIGGGWSLTTILLIVIPVVIVVIVVALIKLKIISVSTEEET